MKKTVTALLLGFLCTALFALPSGYDSVKLGMSVDEVKEALKKTSVFGYRGERDVSLSPSGEDVLIETDATYAPFSFFNRCWFQFSEGRLYIITLNLNTEKIDHYSIFSRLCEKYGNPQEISPTKSQWNDSSVFMSLERPLTLKYIDRQAFEKKQSSSNVNKTSREQSKDEFLEGL